MNKDKEYEKEMSFRERIEGVLEQRDQGEKTTEFIFEEAGFDKEGESFTSAADAHDEERKARGEADNNAKGKKAKAAKPAKPEAQPQA
jgi:hypothetical protein